MRSRFTAYSLGRSDYVSSTWHSSTRPVQLDLRAGPRWLRLEILAVEAGGAQDTTGTVEFVAHWQDGKNCGALHETSRFEREQGQWRYVDGLIHPDTPSGKVGRNDPCPCGSGRKFKHCCC